MVAETKSKSQNGIAALRERLGDFFAEIIELNGEIDKLEAAQAEEQRRQTLSQKQAIIAALKGDEAICEAESLIAALADALNWKIRAEARVKASRAHLEEAKALAYLNGVEGKNAEERTARLTITLRDDAGYQVALTDLQKAENDAESAAATLEVTRAKISANRARTRIIAASIELMAD